MPRFVVFAQEKEAPATTGEGAPGKPARPQSPMGDFLLPLILGLFFLFYFIVLRPAKRRQEAERQSLTTNMNKNDRVLTTAGIYGTIVSVSDKEDEIVVKVDDNTRLKMLKGSIMRNLTREDAVKAEKEQKDKDKTR